MVQVWVGGFHWRRAARDVDPDVDGGGASILNEFLRVLLPEVGPGNAAAVAAAAAAAAAAVAVAVAAVEERDDPIEEEH